MCGQGQECVPFKSALEQVLGWRGMVSCSPVGFSTLMQGHYSRNLLSAFQHSVFRQLKSPFNSPVCCRLGAYFIEMKLSCLFFLSLRIWGNGDEEWSVQSSLEIVFLPVFHIFMQLDGNKTIMERCKMCWGFLILCLF